ncbi:MAG: insulinase family protein [Polyangiales bacterium]
MLAAVGGFDPPALLAALERATGGWSTSGLALRPMISPATPEQRPRTVAVHLEGARVAYVVLALPAPDATQRTRVALDVLEELFGEGPSSPLNRSVRLALGATYGMHASVLSDREVSWLLIHGTVRIDRAGDVLRAMAREVSRLERDGTTAEELRDAVIRARAHSIAAWETDASLTRSIAFNAVMFRDPTFPESFRSEVQQVTRDDLTRLAHAMLRWDRATTVVFGPSGVIVPQLFARELQPVVSH